MGAPARRRPRHSPACLGSLAVMLQDDAHIFCLPTQIESEILGVLDLTEQLLSQFGFQEFEVSAVLRVGCAGPWRPPSLAACSPAPCR